MKPAVAKVVNPLGTVVNIHSDEETDVDTCEDNIIHENCDESLFRPVIAPQAALYHEKNRYYSDKIITKSLDSTTEVAVKILNKNCQNTELAKHSKTVVTPKHTSINKKSKELAKVKDDKSIPLRQELSHKFSKSKHKPKSKLNIDILDPIFNNLGAIHAKDSKILGEDIKFTIPKPLEEINITLAHDKNDFNAEEPPLETEEFFSLESITKSEKFEVMECKENVVSSQKEKKDLKTKGRFSDPDDTFDTTNTSEDNIIDEKYLLKKSRKPRSKLGIKIANIPKDSEKTTEDCSPEVTLPILSKKSWSNICAVKPYAEKSLINPIEQEVDHIMKFQEMTECIEEFTIQLPKKKSDAASIIPDLIDITPQCEETVSEINSFKGLSLGNTDTLKICKTADGEKSDGSSSPTDIVESDDSGKNPDIEVSDVLNDLAESKSRTIKYSRRKKRKK